MMQVVSYGDVLKMHFTKIIKDKMDVLESYQ